MKLVTTAGVAYPLKDTRTRIGRAADNDIVLDEPRVSSYHAELSWDGESLILTDLGSANGTLVNGRPIAGSVRIAPGSRLQMGGIMLALMPDSEIAHQTMVQGGPRAPAPYPPAAAPYAAPAYYSPVYQLKERSTALLLEVGGSILGFMGVGWIYAGQLLVGLILMGAWWGFLAIEVVAAVFTVAISLCITLPLHVGAVALSAIMLNSHMNGRPERFR